MRADLLQLGPEPLALLANRGLVKRAQKMLDAGEGPQLSEDADGRVEGRFPDGVVVDWPAATSLQDAGCTCGSTAICRHRVCVALAYTDTEADAAPPEVWSPGEFTDEALGALIPAHALAAARKRLRDGLDAEVHRSDQPRVHLANGTVRFPVPHALELVHCDAVGPERDVLIALAVWASRAAEGVDPDASVVVVRLQEGEAAVDPAPIAAIERWVATALEVGVANLPGPAGAHLQRARTDAAGAGWVWMADALAALEAQVEAYRTRDARYSLEAVSGLLGEVVGRGRATRSPGPPSAGWFLGTGVAPETRLEHLTLTGLGARVRSVGDAVDIDVYLLDPRAGAVLVLSRTYPREAETPPGSRVAGTARLRLDALAGGQLTTQGALRLANRQVRLAGERGVRKHDLKVGGGAWDGIAPPVRVTGVQALREEHAERPPAALRPRLRAEDLRVLALEAVTSVGWRPGARELVAWARLVGGGEVELRLGHDPAAPGALGALEQALREGPRFVAGHVRLHGGTIAIEPTAVALEGRVVVPAFAPACSVSAGSVGEALRDPVRAAVASGAALLAELAHHGLGAAGARAGRIDEVARGLEAVGLARAAERVRGARGWQGWVDAWLTLAVAREQ